VVNLKKLDFWKFISLLSQILAYIIAAILIIQIYKAIYGGTWQIEEIILALVIFNLTIVFGIGGYLIHLSNKVSNVDKRIHGHFEWHKGKDNSTNLS